MDLGFRQDPKKKYSHYPQNYLIFLINILFEKLDFAKYYSFLGMVPLIKNILLYFNKFIDDQRPFDPEYIFYSFINESNFKIKIAYKLDIALIRIEEAKPTKTVFIPFKDKIKIKIAKRKIKIIKFLNRIKYIFR